MRKFVLLSDIHFPYEDKKALSCAIDFISNYKIDDIILNGDILDFYDCSKYDKDPRRIQGLQKEINKAQEFFALLREIQPEARIVFLKGNHEDRLERYLKRHPELFSLDVLKLPNLLNLKEYNIKYYPEDFKLGPLFITHGSIVRKFSGMSAKEEMLKNDSSGISGHTHRLNAFYRKTPSRYLAWYESGCLCDINPDYVHNPDWQQGFIYGEVGRESFRVSTVPISNGKVMVPEW